MTQLERVAPLLGRIMVSMMFLGSGIQKLRYWGGAAGMMAEKGLPATSLLLGAAVVIELLGGLSLLAGFKARLAAVVMFLYLIPVTLTFHNFWAYVGIERQDPMVHFMKNVAIMGGLLMVFGLGPGPLSLDERSE